MVGKGVEQRSRDLGPGRAGAGLSPDGAMAPARLQKEQHPAAGRQGGGLCCLQAPSSKPPQGIAHHRTERKTLSNGKEKKR